MAKTALSTTAPPIPAERKKAHDDGKRYSLFTVGTDWQVYPGDGVPLQKAEELARMLVTTPDIRLVETA